MKYATQIVTANDRRIEVKVWNAKYDAADVDDLAIRVLWTERSGWASPVSLDGDVAEWAQSGYVLAGKRAVDRVRDA